MDQAPTEQPPQQHSEQKDESVLEEARNYLVQGKRFMALEDYQSATDHLEQAVQLFDAYYGVGKIQCADAYLEYGLALVALANLEAGSGTDKIMKKAGIEGEVEDEEEEDENDDEEEEGNDEQENAGEGSEPVGENDEPENDNKLKNGDSTKTNGGTVAMETSGSSQELTKTNGASNSSSSAAASSTANGDGEPTPGTSSGKIDGDSATNGDEDEEDNEASTIEIAWEVLCLAKRLFMTDESMDGRLKLAETYQKLGEISIEWDNNDNAVSILEECLNIRKAILPPEDRLIALTYYNLGLAHSFNSEIQKANENFHNAVSVIEKRVEILSKDLERAKEAQDTIVVSSYEKEINELKELLPDITMRMDEDSKTDQDECALGLKRSLDEIQQEDEQVKKVVLDKSKPVDDISHLVKRKAA